MPCQYLRIECFDFFFSALLILYRFLILVALLVVFLFFESSKACPRCESIDYIKDGIVNGRQRYVCKSCQYHYTVSKRSGKIPPETRQLALDMYLEGLGFRAIGRLLQVSHTAVFGWVKKAGKHVELPVPSESVEVAELDEMHTFVGQKKVTAGFGLRLSD